MPVSRQSLKIILGIHPDEDRRITLEKLFSAALIRHCPIEVVQKVMDDYQKLLACLDRGIYYNFIESDEEDKAITEVVRQWNELNKKGRK